MFGINKNGTKHKIGIVMPASYPSSRVSYNGGSVETALDNAMKSSDIVLEYKATTAVSIGANTFADSTTGITKAGYTPIAVTSFYGGNSYATPVRWYFDSTNLIVKYYNLASSALSSVSASVGILYKKN